MARQTEERGGGVSDVLEALPTDRLMEQTRELVSAAGERLLASATGKVDDVTDRLIDYVEHGGDGSGGGPKLPVKQLLTVGASGVKQMVKGKLGGGSGKGGGGRGTKVTNIVEQIEVGVPVRVAYNQWTQFQDFPKFTKRLEQVEQKSDEKMVWKAGVFLSHRTWESTILQQIPDEMIVWRSKGDKGHVDGTVTFHELAPNLTKILLVLEYHPQGLFERTGNIWRAQGRRVRLELKHFRRHVMTQTILDPDSVEGWRGEIRDREVVRSHEEAMEEESAEEEPEDDYAEGDAADEDQEPEDENEYEDGEDEEAEGAYEDEDEEAEGAYEDEDETPEDAYEDEEAYEGEDETPEDEEDYEDEEPTDEDEDEDGYEEDGDESDEEPASRSRRRVPARSR